MMTSLMFAASLVLVGTAAFAQDEASTACTHTFTRGTGDGKLSYCVNEHANLMSFSAADVEHVRVGALGGGLIDGYAVCSGLNADVIHGYDAGSAGESHWGANVLLSGPTTTGVGYSRTTADGFLRIDHTFKMDSVEGDVGLTVKVTNVSAVALQGVMYQRFSDFDADGTTGGDMWTRSPDEVEAVEGDGISLNAISFTTSHSAAFANASHVDQCDGGGTFGPVNGTVGDYVAYVRYALGTLGAGKSKTVKLVYKRK